MGHSGTFFVDIRFESHGDHGERRVRVALACDFDGPLCGGACLHRTHGELSARADGIERLVYWLHHTPLVNFKEPILSHHKDGEVRLRICEQLSYLCQRFACTPGVNKQRTRRRFTGRREDNVCRFAVDLDGLAKQLPRIKVPGTTSLALHGDARVRRDHAVLVCDGGHSFTPTNDLLDCRSIRN